MLRILRHSSMYLLLFFIITDITTTWPNVVCVSNSTRLVYELILKWFYDHETSNTEVSDSRKTRDTTRITVDPRTVIQMVNPGRTIYTHLDLNPCDRRKSPERISWDSGNQRFVISPFQSSRSGKVYKDSRRD